MKRSKPGAFTPKEVPAGPGYPSTSSPSSSSPAIREHKRRKVDRIHSMDHFSSLSLETICHIMSYLPFYDAIKMEFLCRKFSQAVTLHLRLVEEIDFTQSEIYGWMPQAFNDLNFKKLLQRCPQLSVMLNLHPTNLSKRRHIASETLSVPGIIDALAECPHLDFVDTSDIFLLEAIMTSLPFISCGDFRNRNGHFPVPSSHKLTLTSSTLTSLRLHGVTITDLPRMESLQHLHLRFVKLTDPQPFRELVCPLLQTFVMAHCAGPADALKYVPLVTGLAAAEKLWRLELIRVPFLGGLFQHVVEDRWRNSAFRKLEKITIGACKHALEVDLGYLLITCSRHIDELQLQPSLTKDSFFMSLIWTDVDFPTFESLSLGFVDAFPEAGKWSNAELSSPAHGLADVVELPAMLTDIGMKAAGRAFTYCKNLSIYNAPHLHYPTSWMTPGEDVWKKLRYIHIRRCHAVWLTDFCVWIAQLDNLESLYIEDMFREAPRGCARVGLSAGTGLGVSSALVTNTGNETPQPANPQQPNNAGAEAANQQADNNDDGDGAGLDNDEAGGANQNNVPGVIPAFAGNPEAGDAHDMEVVDMIEEEVDPEVLEEIEKNASLASCSHTTCDGDCSNQPSCSGVGATLLPEDMKEAAGKDKDHEKDIGNQDEAAMEYDIVTIATNKCSHCGGCVPGARVSCDDREPSAKGKGKGKGKSLRGKKKGIAKQSSAANNSRQVHQSCQAIGEEIREASKKAKENEELNKQATAASQGSNQSQPKTISSQSESRTHNEEQSNERRQLRSDRQTKAGGHSSAGNAKPCGKVEETMGKKKKVPTEHKCTSTSDPVIEDDFIAQELTLCSNSLINLTLRCVGVTRVAVVDCPKLQLLSASACRVLRHVTVRTAPRLVRTSLMQCPRLLLTGNNNNASSSSSSICAVDEENIVHTLCSQPSHRSRLLFLRPMNKQYSQRSLERQVFCRPEYTYHMCVIHDYSLDPAATRYNQRRVSSWIDLLANINYAVLEFPEAESAPKEKKIADKDYPWGRNLHRMQGYNANGSHWELLTDIPWLPPLASAPDLPHHKLKPDDRKPGVYCPAAKGHTTTEVCVNHLTLDIAEQAEQADDPSRKPIHHYAIIVYVNMCDVLNGRATADVYV